MVKATVKGVLCITFIFQGCVTKEVMRHQVTDVISPCQMLKTDVFSLNTESNAPTLYVDITNTIEIYFTNRSLNDTIRLDTKNMKFTDPLTNKTLWKIWIDQIELSPLAYYNIRVSWRSKGQKQGSHVQPDTLAIPIHCSTVTDTLRLILK